MARQQARRKSILDLVAKDISNLQKQVPASQRPKLDSHLSAIQQLEQFMTLFPESTRTLITHRVPLSEVSRTLTHGDGIKNVVQLNLRAA